MWYFRDSKNFQRYSGRKKDSTIAEPQNLLDHSTMSRQIAASSCSPSEPQNFSAKIQFNLLN